MIKHVYNEMEKLFSRENNKINFDKPREIYLFEPLVNMKDAIFLAGPSYRPNQPEFKKDSWRKEAIRIFREMGFKGDFIIPEYRDKNDIPSDWTHRKQVDWEVTGLYRSHRILFWIPRDLKKLPAFTTNIEFGNFMHSGKLIIGWPNDAEKNQYIQDRLDRLGIMRYQKLSEMATDYMKYQKEPPRYFFTSDTHFGSERTRQFSLRPFVNVEQMDLEMVSNINTDLRQKDILVHLGDFGAYEAFEYLNCGKMKFFFGNYERKEEEKCRDELLRKHPDKIRLISQEKNWITLVNPDNKREKQKIYVGHEPTEVRCPKNGIAVYGHTHQRHLARLNGFDVGIDYQYKLFSEKDMWFFINVIRKKFWDKEVHTGYIGKGYEKEHTICELEIEQFKPEINDLDEKK